MAIIARPTDKVMNVNITYEDMSRPIAGPEDPFNQKKNKGMNTLSGMRDPLIGADLAGHVDEQAMDDYSFMMQQRTFDVHGYALNPSTQNGDALPIVGSLKNAHHNGYMSIQDMRPSKAVQRETKRKRAAKGDSSIVEGEGAYVGPWADWQGEKDVDPVFEEEAEEWREEKRRREEATVAAKEAMKLAREEKSIFHGGEDFSLRLKYSEKATREGAHGLRGTDIYAHPYGRRCQAQSVGWYTCAKCISSRQMYTYMGKVIVIQSIVQLC